MVNAGSVCELGYPMRASSLYLCLFVVLTMPVRAITIQIQYDYDTNDFFDPGTTDGAEARAALSAAADRFSEIITTSLDAVPAGSTSGGFNDWRISFSHPGTGNAFEVSTANDAFSDDIVDAGGGAADVYDPTFALPADTWILYAGGQSLPNAAEGGTGTGTNFTTVFTDASSHLRRNWRGGDFASGDLPVWGGAITFDNDGSTNWHFDHETTPTLGEVDFYSIALHEIGHSLGLSSDWGEFTQHVNGSNQFTGPNALAALDADNGTTGTTGINLVSGTNLHFEEDTYDSFPFENGSTPAAGTSGKVLVDLLLEPVADFTASQPRIELTNAEVGALQDMGWEVIPEPSSAGLVLLASCGLALRRRRA